MLGGMNPKQMQNMMKQLGIKTQEIDASEVVIRGEKSYVISNPKVTMMEVQGQKTFQIVGDVKEEEKAAFTDEDVDMVSEKTGKTKEEARKALEESNGDMAEAILSLS